jgi:thiamine-monophosphate kinase
MASAEFKLIADYFTHGFPQRPEVALSVGDDAAVCHVPEGMQLVITVDTLVAGVHFPLETSAEDIGYKALAVNLSDLAAMGATPAWMTLALTCPEVNQTWLGDFTQGLRGLAEFAQVSLIGGDTTRGNLTITLQLMGFVPFNQAITRHDAKVGDAIYVTGTLGDAGLGLAAVQHEIQLPKIHHDYVVSRLNRPTPRLAAGAALRGIANSMLDISDGLAGDLGHILKASKVGATLDLDYLPLSNSLHTQISPAEAQRLALHAGDDYELCFTVPAAKIPQLDKALAGTYFTRVGTITAEPGLRVRAATGQIQTLHAQAYTHFGQPMVCGDQQFKVSSYSFAPTAESYITQTPPNN